MAFTLRLSRELAERLKVYADEWGVTQQSLVTVAIVDYLLLRSHRPASWRDFAAWGPAHARRVAGIASERAVSGLAVPAVAAAQPVSRRLSRQRRRAAEREQAKKEKGK